MLVLVMPRHLLKDCPLIQNMGEKRRFKKKDNKRIMSATWSDSHTSNSKSDEEHTTNICLMTKEVKDNEGFEYESTDKVYIYLYMNALKKN